MIAVIITFSVELTVSLTPELLSHWIVLQGDIKNPTHFSKQVGDVDPGVVVY